MGVHHHKLPIVTDGLVFQVDAANDLCDNVTNVRNIVNPTETGSFLNGASVAGGAYDFDGVDDYINVTPFANIVTNGDISVEFWFKTTSNSQQYLVSTSYPFGTSFSLFMPSNGSGQLWYRRGNATLAGEATSKTSNGYNDGNWHNVICTSGTNMNIYVDGVLDIQGATLTPTILGSTYFFIGVGGVFYYNGQISNSKVYHKELTAAEIEQNYEATKHKFE